MRMWQTLRSDSTLANSTGVRSLVGGSPPPSGAGPVGILADATVRSQIGLCTSTTSLTLAGSPRAPPRLVHRSPSTPAHALAPARSVMAASSASVGSIGTHRKGGPLVKNSGPCRGRSGPSPGRSGCRFGSHPRSKWCVPIVAESQRHQASSLDETQRSVGQPGPSCCRGLRLVRSPRAPDTRTEVTQDPSDDQP